MSTIAEQIASPWREFFEHTDESRRISEGNLVAHLQKDHRMMDVLWAAIDAAEERVWMSMFHFEPDEVGLETLERLRQAARRGCHVLLIYDYLGSINLKKRHVWPLEAEGGQTLVFNRIWPPWEKNGAIGIRNHRKLIIIDNDVAFCGGMNICDDYAGEGFGDWVFDDTLARIEGPAVRDFAYVFMHTWRQKTGQELQLPEPAPMRSNGIPVQVLQTDPRRPETNMIEVLGGAISHARERCDITTPYLIPDDWLLEAIYTARDNGADVRIVSAGAIDRNIARHAAHHFYDDLLERGVRIYERRKRVIHTKKVSVDSAFCALGSYNFDLWTTRHVLDVGFVTVDHDLARSFEDEFEVDVENSTEIDPERWRRRWFTEDIRDWMALQVAKRL